MECIVKLTVGCLCLVAGVCLSRQPPRRSNCATSLLSCSHSTTFRTSSFTFDAFSTNDGCFLSKTNSTLSLPYQIQRHWSLDRHPVGRPTDSLRLPMPQFFSLCFVPSGAVLCPWDSNCAQTKACCVFVIRANSYFVYVYIYCALRNQIYGLLQCLSVHHSRQLWPSRSRSRLDNSVLSDVFGVSIYSTIKN